MLEKILLMRGIPGSGKTTWARENHPGMSVCSADLFPGFWTEGEYRFVPSSIGDAHGFCFDQYFCHLIEFPMNSTRVLVVDNTNIHAWELAPYIALANRAGVPWEIVQIECDPSTAAARNVHGVPPEKVATMWCNLLSEKLPHHWKEKVRTIR